MAVLHDKMCAHTHTIISCTFQLVLLTKRHPWDFDWMCVISSITQLEEQTILVKKSLSEVLIFASTNPQYDNKLFNTWQFQAQNMGRTCCVQKLFLTFRTISVCNLQI